MQHSKKKRNVYIFCLTLKVFEVQILLPDRRTFLKYMATAGGSLVIGAALGYAFRGPVSREEVPTGTTTVSKKQTVKVGLAAFLSGPFVTDGTHSVNAAKMAVEEASGANWFLDGSNVELYLADLGAVTPEQVSKAMEQLILTYKVNIIVSYWGTYGPGWDYVLKYKIPLITGDTPLGVTDFLSQHPEAMIVDTYSPLGTKRYQRTFLRFFEWLQNTGQWKPRNKPPTMYIVYSDFIWDTNWAEIMKSEALNNGWKIVGYDLVPSGTPDFSGIISKIRSADPDVVIHANLFPADSGIFATQFATNPSKSLLCNSFGFAPPEAIKVGDPDKLIGVIWGSGSMFIRKSELWKNFRNRYISKYGLEPNIAASHTYDSIMIALNAINLARELDAESIYNAIFKIAYRGLEGTWVFDPVEKIAYDYPNLVPNQILQIQKIDGKIDQYVSIYPSEIAYSKFILPPWL